MEGNTGSSLCLKVMRHRHSALLCYMEEVQSLQVLTLLYTKDLVWGSYPMFSRQQRILKFRCHRQVWLMCPAALTGSVLVHVRSACVL